MKRGAIEQIQFENVCRLYPEFSAFVHRVSYLTPDQQHRLVVRMALNSVRIGECICWHAHCNNDGYPKTNFTVAGEERSLYLHHLSFRMATGRAPRDWQDHSHKCDTAACINPEHLFLERKVDNYTRSAINTNRKKARDLKRRQQHDDERISE